MKVLILGSGYAGVTDGSTLEQLGSASVFCSANLPVAAAKDPSLGSALCS